MSYEYRPDAEMEGWFSPDEVVSLRMTPDVALRFWFYEGDCKITLSVSTLAATAPERFEVCDARQFSQLTYCPLLKNHECPHFPMPLQERFNRGREMPVDSVRIEKADP